LFFDISYSSTQLMDAERARLLFSDGIGQMVCIRHTIINLDLLFIFCSDFLKAFFRYVSFAVAAKAAMRQSFRAPART
jgi:hypothetical protein